MRKKTNHSTREKNGKFEIEITPFVRSLSQKVRIPRDINLKEEYLRHLDKKYK